MGLQVFAVYPILEMRLGTPIVNPLAFLRTYSADYLTVLLLTELSLFLIYVLARSLAAARDS